MMSMTVLMNRKLYSLFYKILLSIRYYILIDMNQRKNGSPDLGAAYKTQA